MAGALLSSADGARVPVEMCVNPADADFEFGVPMTAEDPGVAVGHTGSGAPALIAVVFEFAEVATEEFYVIVDVTDIELTADAVETEEMALECLAEPITGFGLDHPVAPAAFVDIPGVKLAGEVESPFWLHFEFDTEAWRSDGIAYKVSLNPDFLGMAGQGHKDQ